MAQTEPRPHTEPRPLRRFGGRRAIVTGASRGIGAAVAQRLAAEGAHVALVARTHAPGGPLPGSLAETVERIGDGPGDAVALVADLSRAEQRETVVPRAVDALGGPIDILVNNAAAAIYAPAASMPDRHRRLLFELNLHTPVELAAACVPAMAARGEGWIVNVSSRSAASWHGPPFELGPTGTTTALYGASKAALERAGNGLAAELADRGVRVNAVAPRAAVMTEGARALVGDVLGPDQLEPLEQMVEAVVALCCCGPELTGTSTSSDQLLDRLALAVRSLDGTPLRHRPTSPP